MVSRIERGGGRRAFAPWRPPCFSGEVRTGGARSERGDRSDIRFREGGARFRRCTAPYGRHTLTATLSDAPTRPELEAGPASARAVTAATLLERHEELARIESALEDARSGRGRFLVIEGPAGIGKTALLAAARATAAERGCSCCGRAEPSWSATSRSESFASCSSRRWPTLPSSSAPNCSSRVPASPRASSGFRAHLPRRARRRRTSDPSFAILHGLYWLCANLAAASPLCIVVDDAHWADAPSLRYLAFLLPRLEELDVALVLATRPCDAGTDPELLASVATDPSAELITLRPLTRAAIAQLVESTLAGEPDPVFVDACLRATRGTPFLLRVLLEALREGEIAPTAEAACHVERIGARGRRSIDSPEASPFAGARGAARPCTRRPRAGRPAPGCATRGPRRSPRLPTPQTSS